MNRLKQEKDGPSGWLSYTAEGFDQSIVRSLELTKAIEKLKESTDFLLLVRNTDGSYSSSGRITGGEDMLNDLDEFFHYIMKVARKARKDDEPKEG